MVNISLSTKSPPTSSKLTYSVLIDKEQDGRFSAVVIGLPEFRSSGINEDEAVEKLQQLLRKRLQTAKILTLEVDAPQGENPWMEIAGMYKDNPLFDEVLAKIEVERGKLDAEIDEYYQRLDVEYEGK